MSVMVRPSHAIHSTRARISQCRNMLTAPQRSIEFFSCIVSPSERSEEHTSELQSLMRISYAVFCLKKKKKPIQQRRTNTSITTAHNNNQQTNQQRAHALNN